MCMYDTHNHRQTDKWPVSESVHYLKDSTGRLHYNTIAIDTYLKTDHLKLKYNKR